MAAQLRGHRLGWINNQLYQMRYARDGLVDLAPGLGTVNTPRFGHKLALQPDDDDHEMSAP